MFRSLSDSPKLTNLPSRGLEDLRELHFENCSSLRMIPPTVKFANIKKVALLWNRCSCCLSCYEVNVSVITLTALWFQIDILFMHSIVFCHSSGKSQRHYLLLVIGYLFSIDYQLLTIYCWLLISWLAESIDCGFFFQVKLTYPQHCCAFKKPHSQDRQTYDQVCVDIPARAGSSCLTALYHTGS